MSVATAKPAPTVHEVLARFDASPELIRLATAEANPAKLVTLLMKQSRADEAVEFIARWLSPRQAVWWGCLALWDVYRPEPPAEVDAALAAIVRWVEEPSEENRRGAEVGGNVLGAKHPVGALSLATFWTSGSMTRADLPAVEPPKDMSVQVIAAALNLAVYRQPASRRDELFQHFAKLGLEVASEPAHWELAEATQ